MAEIVDDIVQKSCCPPLSGDAAPVVENSLSGFFGNLFDTSSYPPRWQCGSWTSLEGWLHIVSDLGIFVAYFAIPLALVYFVWKRKDVPFNGIFFLFAAFILFCGTGHLLEAVIFYYPLYRIAGLVKLATALVSLLTFFVLLKLIPQALDLPSLVTKNELLKRADVSKTQFLANMSHEIRTPMTAILGYAEVLDGDQATLLPEQRREALDAIKRNGDHLLNVINEILDLSKIEAGKLDYDKSPCCPVKITTEVISLLQIRAAEKGVLLDARIASDCPKTIFTDPVRLKQVLINVVANAVKFTAEGSVCVTVNVRNEFGKKSHLAFEVVDTGIGIHPDAMDDLFAAFTQADASTTRKFGGTGLGLSISKHLAIGLGGDISVESTLGVGSTFTLTVALGPRENMAAAADAKVSQESPVAINASGGIPSGDPKKLNCRVLLVEDGIDNQRLLSFILKKAGADVTVADNGQLALDRVAEAEARNERFDVILMDMQMPVMDGYEATTQLRARGYGRPIVALTAHAMSGDREKCLSAGCDNFATKPIDRAELIELVNAYARGVNRPWSFGDQLAPSGVWTSENDS